tara:strand:- start:21798 stop:22139 length:342 start_codon:yes stop_codon:yes gene_type:complete
MSDPHLLGTDLTVTSIDNVSVNYTGTAVGTSIYTRHSYQVLTDGLPASGHFRVLVSNQEGDSARFLPVANYTIDSTTNSEGLLYADTWNFLQAKVDLTGVSAGRFTVIENHNY